VTNETNDYHLVTSWRVEGTCGEVADVLGDAAALTQWWPAVYVHVEQLAPPDARGVGQTLRVLTKGWLPYTLEWTLVVADVRYPYGFTVEATGDLTGRGVWTFVQDGSFVNVTYDWRVHADKPLLRLLSPVAWPLFAANHRWAMRQGEESLQLELRRRRATSNTVRTAIPPPPGPVTYAGIAVLGGASLIGATLAYLILRVRRRAEDDE
jgi:hypothetical protein